jgi:hypothetical protein
MKGAVHGAGPSGAQEAVGAKEEKGRRKKKRKCVVVSRGGAAVFYRWMAADPGGQSGQDSARPKGGTE